MINTIRDIFREMQAKKWLAVALTAEALGLVGAASSIPVVGILPLTWTLAVVGLLSTLGVVIVTTHYVWEYNSRPLNNTQRTEVKELLSEKADSLVPKSELSNFVPNSQLFWIWRYQKSVMDLAWTVDDLLAQPGYVVVAELDSIDSLIRKVELSLVPPPVVNVGEFLSTLGEDPPPQYHDWGTLFHEFGGPIIFYRNADRKTKYLRVDQKMVFDDRLAAPIPVSQTGTATLPELQKIKKKVTSHHRDWEYEWVWKTPQST